jgi:superfamily II DNA or RNA helicase
MGLKKETEIETETMEHEKEDTINRYITRRGYTIRKSSLTPRSEQKIRKELDVQPFEKERWKMEKFGNLPPKFKVYLESSSKLYIPKYYGLEQLGYAKSLIGECGEMIDLKFNGELRTEQKSIMEDFLKDFLKNSGGILNLRTGGGKTAMALYIVSLLKKKTLIVVHKEFLLNQWVSRITQFLPNCRIGIIQSNKLQIENCDIVIGMLQSLSQRSYPDGTFDSFGLNVLDEVHNFSANCFSRCLPKISTQFNLGLSATVQRKDGMEKILHWHIGPVFEVGQSAESIGEIRCYMVPFKDPEYQQTFFNARGNANLPKMVTRLVESPKREAFILTLIKHLHGLGRKTLVLSERRSQVDNLSLKLNSMGITNGKCLGGIKQEVLEHSIEQSVLLATYSYVQEAFDVPELNTLILASPKTDVVQAVGRILRQEPHKRKFIPLIVDIVDSTQRMEKKSITRKSFYKKAKFSLIQFKDENIHEIV